MAKKITALQLDATNPSDLMTLAIGQVPMRLDGAVPQGVGTVVEIVHNEGGLSGLYKHRMKSCYRVGLDNGVNIVVPSDEVKFVIVTEGEISGG
jgi:hypothetical protein